MRSILPDTRYWLEIIFNSCWSCSCNNKYLFIDFSVAIRCCEYNYLLEEFVMHSHCACAMYIDVVHDCIRFSFCCRGRFCCCSTFSICIYVATLLHPSIWYDHFERVLHNFWCNLKKWRAIRSIDTSTLIVIFGVLMEIHRKFNLNLLF